MTKTRLFEMSHQMKRRTFATVIFAATLLLLSSAVQAQVEAPGVSSDQSVAQGAVIPPSPPAGFDARTASAVELELYGFPPAPSVGTPEYSRWLSLVSPSITRITPTLEQTVITNGSAQNVSIKAPAPGSNSVSTTSSNWSGYAQYGAAGTFKHNNDFVFAEWILPKAQQAFGTCDGTYWYSSQWVGFDGFGSGDVLQAGTESDAYCSGGVTTTFYSAWYEWYPFNEVRVSLPVSGGDLMGSEVWYTTASPYGHAFIVDYTNQNSISIAFNPPPGTVYKGNSVEWVEERPGINGGLANLTNYVADPFNFDYARAGGKTYYAGVSPGGTTVYSISMTCPPWSPSSSCKSTTKISIPSLYGTETLWLYNYAPSF